MLFILICSYLILTVSFDLTSIRKALKHSESLKYYEPDYTVPSWAYKKAFNHNKVYNKITKKLKTKEQTYEEQKKICKFYGIPLKYLD